MRSGPGRCVACAGDVRSGLSQLAARYYTRSLQITRLSLERAIRHAEANNIVGRNVAALVKAPQGHGGRPSKSLTLDEAKALLTAAEGTRLHAYVVLSLLVGIRTEEARALRWDHVVTWADDSAGWQPVTTAGFDPARAGEDRYAIYVWRWDGRPSPRAVSLPIRVAHPGWARDRSSVGCSAPGRPRLTARHFPQCHLVGEALDEDRASQEEFVHGGDRSPSCGTSAPVGVPLAKGIRPLGRQCHRPSSDTASLGDEGAKGMLVHDQRRQLQEGCPAPRRGDWAALHRSADRSRGSRCADAPRARCRAASRSSPGSPRH